MPEPSHRRGVAVAENVLDATLFLIAERGYAFSVEDVAALARVHKTTIYRRWETKSALVGAAAQRLASQEIVFTRTIDPIVDLTTLAELVAKSLRHPAAMRTLRALVVAAEEDPGLVSTAQQFLADRYEIAVALIDEAKARCELRRDVDSTLVWEAIVNPLHLRAILGTPANDDVARSLVSLVIGGARSQNLPSATVDTGIGG